MNHHAENMLSLTAQHLRTLARSLASEAEKPDGTPAEAALSLSELQALTLLGRLLQLQIDQAAHRAYRAGASYTALGTAAGLSPAGARGRWSSPGILRRPGRRAALKERDLLQAQRRRAAGEAVSSIAEDLGVDRSTLYRALKRSSPAARERPDREGSQGP
ncbi:Hin recombinase [Nocardiopsis sp. CNT-189]|uniref:helix-turn-helix domain-containing protein n=1 Tax=Nocardiopsis oceanisediminis TaxID=2816862 RepID=UPI003B356203